MTPKEKSIRVRLTDDEHKMLEEATKKAGFMALSEYVRYMTIGEGSKLVADIEPKLDAIIKKLDKK